MKEESTRAHDHFNSFKKPLDKTQYYFMTKALNKLGIESNYLNIIKTIYI